MSAFQTGLNTAMERGMDLFRDGRYEEAARTFRATHPSTAGHVSDLLRLEGDAWRVAGQRWRAYEAHKAALAAADRANDLARHGACCAALAESTLAMHGAL